MFGLGLHPSGLVKGITLMTSNEEMKYIMKIVKSPKNLVHWQIVLVNQFQMKQKDKKVDCSVCC